MTQIFLWSGSLTYFDCLYFPFLHNHMRSRLLKKKKKKEDFFRNFCDGNMPSTSLLYITLIMTYLTALVHRICGVLFWNISFIFLKPLCAGWLRYEKRPVLVHKEICPVVNDTACIFQNASFPAHYFMILSSRSVYQPQTSKVFKVHALPQPCKLLIWTIHCLTRFKNNWQFWWR